MRDLDKELIERYLWGQLSEKELEALHARKESDAEFAAALEEEEKLRQFLRRQEGREKLANLSTDLGREFFPPEKVVPISSWRKMYRPFAIAAAILAAAILTWLWAFPPSPQSLYQTYATHEALELTDRADGASLKRLQDQFNDGRYLDAIPDLVALRATNESDLEIQRALGVSYLETGQLDKALELFIDLAEGESAYAEDGIWYAALTYLRMEETEAAKEWLAKVERGTRWYSSARKLARRL
jgi:tetratricopeptide (TPR) repeat protein